MLADARGGQEVERPRPEPVGRAGQGADRADLHGVAGEVGLERLVLVDADLLQRTPLDERDERVAGDLVGEPRAAGAEHAPLPVEEHLAGDVDRLGVGPLDVLEPGRAAAVAHGLVLQWALAALVADRAVERVVDEQQLHDALLRLVGDGRRQLGVDLHALGHRDGARGLRLRHRPHRAVRTRRRDVDEALAAGAHRLEERVVAEPRDLDPDLLGGPDDQGALGHPGLDAVDGQRDVVRRPWGAGRRRRC